MLIPDGVRAVFFDAVNTLLFPDPSAPHIYAELARRHGLAISTEEVQARFLDAYRAEEAIDRAARWVTSESREIERWRRIVNSTLAGVDDPELCFSTLHKHFGKPAAWRLDEGAERVLSELVGRGLVIGLGSNYDSRLHSVIDGFLELSMLCSRIVVSAAVGYRKPAREFFREVARVAECEPGEVLFVGDDYENDYLGAANSGMAAILLDPRSRHPETRRIGNLRELLL